MGDVRRGKEAATRRVVGGGMRATGGKANPQLAEEPLGELLSGEVKDE